MFVSIDNKKENITWRHSLLKVYYYNTVVHVVGLSYIEVFSQWINRPIDMTYNPKIKFKAVYAVGKVKVKITDISREKKEGDFI